MIKSREQITLPASKARQQANHVLSDKNFLNLLTIESTLNDLPYWEIHLQEAALSKEAATIFENNHLLPGIMICNRETIVGIISRERFYNKVGRRFGVDLFYRRPVLFLLDDANNKPTVFDHTISIQAATETCLARPENFIYEPFALKLPGHPPRLIGFRDLIVAQTRLLALASKTKDQFLATMSHELRTPLTSIFGYCEIVKEDIEEAGLDDSATMLGKLQVSATQLLELIDSILDLSKTETGGMDLKLETFDLSELIDEVHGTIVPLAKKNSNHLTISCPRDIGAMHADRFKVRQNILNFLCNACKFTLNGHVSLDVKRENSWFVFAVKDTGIGMTPEQIKQIFKPFVQGDSSTTRKYGGTGLGLAIAHRFCELMGGDISVTSQLHMGTIFTMKLPLVVKPIKNNR